MVAKFIFSAKICSLIIILPYLSKHIHDNSIVILIYILNEIMALLYSENIVKSTLPQKIVISCCAYHPCTNSKINNIITYKKVHGGESAWEL
jgi:hypothetical protein